MGVLDELKEAEAKAMSRLAELEPLVAEYEELKREVDQLGLASRGDAQEIVDAAERSTARRRRGRRASASTSSRRSRRRAGESRSSGSRRDDVLRLVQQSDGITVREIGSRLGVDPTGLYRVARALQDEGVVRKEGTKLVAATS